MTTFLATPEAAELVQRLSDQAMRTMGPLLGGLPPEIQAGVLADLTARWLAGHQDPNKDELRKELLAMFVEAVRYLTPVNEAILLEQQQRRRSPKPH